MSREDWASAMLVRGGEPNLVDYVHVRSEARGKVEVILYDEGLPLSALRMEPPPDCVEDEGNQFGANQNGYR
jgi:hypothetical protein